MRIIIDAMGGDRAPEEIIKGACAASLETDAQLVLVGREDIMSEYIAKYPHAETLETIHADSVIEMDDDPMSVVKSKKDSSMSVGLRLLKESADAFVSAGSTGALHAGATLSVRNMKGVRRAAIATLLPFEQPTLLMDSGANITVTPENLLQWAHIGSLYMQKVLGIEHPRVGLLNNGTEDCKGTQLQRDAYALLSESEDIEFVGNIEGKQIPFAACDVLVTDGFTGNITLKLTEGMAKFLLGILKDTFSSGLRGKIAYLLMRSSLRSLKGRFDASKLGGAPILGISRPVIKAHGSSDAEAIKNAVLQAERFAASGIIDELSSVLAAR